MLGKIEMMESAIAVAVGATAADTLDAVPWRLCNILSLAKVVVAKAVT